MNDVCVAIEWRDLFAPSKSCLLHGLPMLTRSTYPDVGIAEGMKGFSHQQPFLPFLPPDGLPAGFGLDFGDLAIGVKLQLETDMKAD